MTDKQIRDRIVGALSVSMMPMEVELECIQFLDQCLAVPKKPVVAAASNGDRIRSMTDAQLAAYWANHSGDFCQYKPECCEALDRDEQIPDARCAACALVWLRQRAEDPTSTATAAEDKQYSGLDGED